MYEYEELEINSAAASPLNENCSNEFSFIHEQKLNRLYIKLNYVDWIY